MRLNVLPKIATTILAAMAFSQISASCKNELEANNNEDTTMEKILFINGSPNRDGNTAALAKILLEDRQYETINLNDFRINFYGQTHEGDRFDEVLAKMKEADVIVMGSPVYWHNICASVRTLMERFYEYVPESTFSGKRLFFVYQGAAPTEMMIEDGEYTMSRFARMYGFSDEGMATNSNEARELASKI